MKYNRTCFNITYKKTLPVIRRNHAGVPMKITTSIYPIKTGVSRMSP